MQHVKLESTDSNHVDIFQLNSIKMCIMFKSLFIYIYMKGSDRESKGERGTGREEGEPSHLSSLRSENCLQ